MLGGLSFPATLMLANSFPAAYLAAYHLLLVGPPRGGTEPRLARHSSDAEALAADGEEDLRQQGQRRGGSGSGVAAGAGEQQRLLVAGQGGGSGRAHGPISGEQHPQQGSDGWQPDAAVKPGWARGVSWRERAQRTAALSPYMIPLVRFRGRALLWCG